MRTSLFLQNCSWLDSAESKRGESARFLALNLKKFWSKWTQNYYRSCSEHGRINFKPIKSKRPLISSPQVLEIEEMSPKIQISRRQFSQIYGLALPRRFALSTNQKRAYQKDFSLSQSGRSAILKICSQPIRMSNKGGESDQSQPSKHHSWKHENFKEMTENLVKMKQNTKFVKTEENFVRTTEATEYIKAANFEVTSVFRGIPCR